MVRVTLPLIISPSMVPEISGFVGDPEEATEVPVKKKSTKRISKKRSHGKSGMANAVQQGPSEAAVAPEVDARAARASRRSSASHAESNDQA